MEVKYKSKKKRIEYDAYSIDDYFDGEHWAGELVIVLFSNLDAVVALACGEQYSDEFPPFLLNVEDTDWTMSRDVLEEDHPDALIIPIETKCTLNIYDLPKVDKVIKPYLKRFE